MTKKAECAFQPFDKDPEVCDRCGELVGAGVHSGSEALGKAGVGSGYQRDLWTVLVRLGGIHGYYGRSLDRVRTAVLRKHIGMSLEADREDPACWKGWGWQGVRGTLAKETGGCALDLGASGMPSMGDLSFFAGTDHSDDVEAAVVGDLWCVCRKYVDTQVSLRDKTMGQLIWLVSREGLEKEEKEEGK